MSWQDTGMRIREAVAKRDGDAIWAILKPVFRAGETYPQPRDMDRESALAYWFSPGDEVFAAEDRGEIVGTYFLKANQKGGGAHVANCGYMTAPHATGRGVARAMCTHSLERARERGFHAMQFNFVVSTNERALRLWQSLGFEIVGRLPLAFEHPSLGFVDVYVMFQDLGYGPGEGEKLGAQSSV
jgi:ribosomal protein S18 acetylase RimI-like enzyme